MDSDLGHNHIHTHTHTHTPSDMIERKKARNRGIQELRGVGVVLDWALVRCKEIGDKPNCIKCISIFAFHWIPPPTSPSILNSIIHIPLISTAPLPCAINSVQLLHFSIHLIILHSLSLLIYSPLSSSSINHVERGIHTQDNEDDPKCRTRLF